MTDVAERLRMELLEKLEKEISLDRIRQILSAAPEGDGRAALKIFAANVSRVVVSAFRFHVPITKGRPTMNQARDRRIAILKLKGKSYEQIAKQMGINRNAAQAALRRYNADPLSELDNLSEDS